MEIPVIYEIKAFINNLPLCAGLENIAEALNESVQQYYFLCGHGFATNKVTGIAPAITFTGRRVYGDPAQEYIFERKYSVGAERDSVFKMVLEDNSGEATVTTTIEVPCTICNVQEINGNAQENFAISFEIRFNGAPTKTVEGNLPELNVISLAGTSGKTAITVAPAKGGSNSYYYKTDTVVEMPKLNADVSDWTSWDGSAEITATNGNEIVIVEADVNAKALKGGKAIVVAG